MGRKTIDEVFAARGDTDTEEFKQAYAEADAALRFGQLVYELRTAAGLTQRALAERMGTTASVVNRLEQGGSAATLTTVSRLARALGVRLRIAVDGAPDVMTVVLGVRAGERTTKDGKKKPARNPTPTGKPLPVPEGK